MTPSWKRNFYTLWITELIVIAGMQSCQPFLPYYIQELGVSDLDEALIWSGQIGSVAGLAMALSAPVWGNLADRFGRKPMVVRAMLGGGVSILLTAHVVNPEQLLIVRFLHGILSGTVTACVALVATTTPRRELGFAMGMMHGVFMLGATVGPYIGGHLIEQFGFRQTFQLAGFCVLAGGLFVQILVHEDFHRTKKADLVAASGSESSRAGSGPWRDSVRLLRGRPFRVLMIGSFLTQFAFALSTPVLPLFLQRLAGGHAVVSIAGLIFALAGLVGALSSIALGRRAEALGFQNILIVSLILSALFAVAQGFAVSVVQLGILMVASGAAAGALRPVINVMMTHFVDEGDRGTAFGVMASASAMGWAPGPVLGGYLAAELGFRPVFLLMAGLFCVLGIVFWRSRGALYEKADSPADGM